MMGRITEAEGQTDGREDEGGRHGETDRDNLSQRDRQTDRVHMKTDLQIEAELDK